MATVNSSLQDSIVSQSALEAFTAELLPVNVLTTSFSADVVRRGASVQVPLVANLTATTFNSDYAGDGGTLNVVSVNVDKHKIVTVSLSDSDWSKSSAAELTKFANQAGRALAQAVLTDVFSMFVTTASSATQFAASLTGLTQFTIANAGTIRKALSDSNVPKMDRSLVLNSALYASLLTQSGLLDASQFGARDAIAEGKVPRIMGMNAYESVILPLNSISLAGIAVHPNAGALAVRALAPQEPSTYVSANTVTDPQSGLTLGVRNVYNPLTGKAHLSFECVYGYSRAITAGAKLILSA